MYSFKLFIPLYYIWYNILYVSYSPARVKNKVSENDPQKYYVTKNTILHFTRHENSTAAFWDKVS